MALDDDIKFLAQVSLFRGFSRDQLRLLAFGAERDRLTAGAFLFHEGEDATGGYVVTAGQINLTTTKSDGEFILDRCFQGTLIGELALIAPGKRVAHAVARVESEVLHIPRPLFRRMITEYPQTAEVLQAEIVQSVRRLLLRLEKLQRKLDTIEPLTPEGSGEGAPEGDARPPG